MGIDVEVDMKGWDNIIRDMENLNGKQIEYGFPEEVMHPEAEQPVHLIAYWNNYGTKSSQQKGLWHIPPRPFLTDAAILSEFEMDKLTTMIMYSVGEGNTALNNSLDRVGKDLADLVRQQITEGNYAALAPSTIARKSSDTLLIESAFMFDNIKHKMTVKPKGG